nr:hypothetical protein [Pacificibacter maritimus]
MKSHSALEDGAITVDWVVISAAVIGLAIAVIASISGGAITYATYLNEDVVDIAYEAGYSGKTGVPD